MSKKYVMANINIPIQVDTNDNNKLMPLTEYVKISISNCDSLPEKSSNSFTIMEQINNLFSITPSVKENETNSFSVTDKSPTERNPGDALRPNLLFVQYNEPSIIDDSVLFSNIEDGTINIVPDTDSSTDSDTESGDDSDTVSSEESETNSFSFANDVTISLNEILNKKTKTQHLNTSFKNKPTTSSRYTLKNSS